MKNNTKSHYILLSSSNKLKDEKKEIHFIINTQKRCQGKMIVVNMDLIQ
jgi:hypothetical protein